jgi:pimeloyl-ACP methyl ester carboxylesterase
MGGLIAVALVERNPGLFDGALPMCGVLGGTDMAVDYIYNVRVLFDYFYPGVLPGSAVEIPEGFHWSQAQGLAYSAIIANPLPAFEMGGIAPVNIQYQSPQELINAILTALVFHNASLADFVDRTHGHDFFDNADIVYSGSSDDAALNAGVGRYSSTADAEAFIRHYAEPTGDLRMPVVTLHNTRDPVVQIFNEHDYALKVAALGGMDLLTQFELDSFGHCNFTMEEMLGAFAELVDQVDARQAADRSLAPR